MNSSSVSKRGDREVLIVGAGIAGPTLAHWLLRYGPVPTLVERAPRLRTGGYVIDFWGAGYDIAERMGLMPEIQRAGYRLRELRIVDGRGRRVAGFDADLFRRATYGRYVSLPRSSLSAILNRSIAGGVETRFGESVTALEPDGCGVQVRFQHASPRRFDLVIGADGLHSIVRATTFGPESSFEVFMGYTVVAFEVAGYRPRDEEVYVAYSLPGRQVARFSMREDRTMFLFVVVDAAPVVDPHDREAQRSYLRRQFAGSKWETDAILAAMDQAEDLYFDRVSQIRLDRWTRGAIALVGDAAFAPSLLAGQGSALAMIGAYVLAGELARAPRLEEGLARYEALLREFMLEKQRAAAGSAKAFAPRTRFGIWVRDQVTRALGLPGVARWALGNSLLDRIELPDYELRQA